MASKRVDTHRTWPIPKASVEGGIAESKGHGVQLRPGSQPTSSAVACLDALSVNRLG